MHVNPDEAVQIHQDVQSRFSVGITLGNFLESNRGTVTGTITTAERSPVGEEVKSRQLHHTETRSNLETLNDRNYGKSGGSAS